MSWRLDFLTRKNRMLACVQLIFSRFYGSLSLGRAYLLLILFATILTGFCFIYKDEWVGAYLSNIAGGLFGSLLLIFLVDKIIERNRENERRQNVKIALGRLRFPIKDHMSLLCDIYKAATQSKPRSLPTTFEGTFTDDYYREISLLDFTKDAGWALKTDWFTRLDLETKILKDKLEQVIEAYAIFLDVALKNILERIINSSFVRFVPQIRMLLKIDRQHQFKRAYYTMFAGMENDVKEHVSNMLELIKYFNAHADPPPIQLIQGQWSDLSSPTWGSGRFSTNKQA